MLAQLVKSALQGEVDSMKDRAAAAFISAFGALILILALGFAKLALFLGLSQLMPAWQAALVVAGGLLLIAIIVFLVARSIRNRRQTQRARLAADFQALVKDAGGTTPKGDMTLGTIAAALVAGLVIGRSINK